MWAYSSSNDIWKLKEVDQELQGGCISIFLIKLLNVSWELEEVDQQLQEGHMSIFLTRCVLKTWESRPAASRRIHWYIPHYWLPFRYPSRVDCKVLKFTLVKHMLFAMRWQRVRLKILEKKRVCCACIEKYTVSSITLRVNMSAHGACNWLKQCIWFRRNA